MKNLKLQRGFTIIELIVVIAIIAVLSAIVLVNVVPYNKRGKDSAIKAQASQIRSAGTDFFSTYSTYTGMCNLNTQCSKIESNITKLGGSLGGNLSTQATTFCIDFKLSDSVTLWCVDNTGYNGPTDNCSSSPMTPHVSCQ